MCGKFFCGMLTGVAAGAAIAVTVKNMCDKNDTKRIKRKAKKLIDKVERYVSDSMPFSD